VKTIEYTPIGTIHTPFKNLEDVPIQSGIARGIKGRVEICPEYEAALTDLDRFSHLILIYHFHLAKEGSLIVKPPHENAFHGILATRATGRPNPIGLSIVSLKAVAGTSLYIADIDVVDGTPLLDLKPFIPTIDRQYGANLGWLADRYEEK
jgi:tRNA-Thr(GGU) m(6)t(6)A37 methyltransferase TsaA